MSCRTCDGLRPESLKPDRLARTPRNGAQRAEQASYHKRAAPRADGASRTAEESQPHTQTHAPTTCQRRRSPAPWHRHRQVSVAAVSARGQCQPKGPLASLYMYASRVAFADMYCGSLFGERPVPPSRLHTGYGITIMYVYVERQHTRSIHVRGLPTGTQRCPCPCPTVAARSGSTQHNRASPTRAMCLADGHGLDGKVDTSESQTLARAPGPRGNKRHLRVACGDETRGPLSLLHHHKHYCLGRGDVHVKEEAEAR